MKRNKPVGVLDGWNGWDDYAPFYDWENNRTIGRADLPFWRDLVRRTAQGPVLELGCGTGRVSVPLAQSGAALVGVDRSEAMLRRHRQRARRAGLHERIRLVRADIRDLAFTQKFSLVLAPYGILQSLLRERDLERTLASVWRVTQEGGLLAIDLASDLPSWKEYRNRIALAGARGRGVRLTLIESVRQDRRRHLTIFEERYIERRAHQPRQEARFRIAFRTLSVLQMGRRLERAGFDVEAVLGDYQGSPWHRDADVWVILARKKQAC